MFSRSHRWNRLTAVLLALALSLAAADAPPAVWLSAIDRISADSLRGHLSFLASDLLEGRKTPSRGLDLAAEYIAAQFRRAGLEAAGDDGYFQTAALTQVEPSSEGIELSLENGSVSLTAAKGAVLPRSPRAAELSEVPVFKASDSLHAEDVKGRAVVLARGRGSAGILAKLRTMQPAAIVTFGPRISRSPQILDLGEKRAETPWVSVSDPEMIRAMEALAPGLSEWKLSLRIPRPKQTPVKVRNVIGLLRGSDAALKDTYVLLSAHYDHLGVAAGGKIYNGANDDASGTVSVIEIAAALAALPQHPRRSIVFLALFGEEEGLLGSKYYVDHPVFPLDKTVADINLEQLGRTDANNGPQIATATLTGYDYSDVPPVFQKAGEMTGVNVYKAPNGGDEYFNRSDNESFADRGIPAHTVVVAFEFPDYHAVGDTWTKIDYANLAKVDRMLALGILMLADSPQAPKWNR
jgi:hypothetical protein